MKLKRKVFLAHLLSVLFAPSLAMSEDFGRTTTSGNWLDGNWRSSSGVVGSPGGSDNANIGVGAGAPASWATNVSVDLTSSEAIQGLTLGDGTSTGVLNIGGSASLDANSVTVNAGSSLISVGGLTSNVLNLNGLGSSASLQGTTSLGYLNASSGALVTVAAPLFVGAQIDLYDSTLDVGGAIELLGTMYTGGGTINQNADITGYNLELGWGGTATSFNRTSGNLSLDYLSLYSGSSLTLNAGDSVSTNLYVGNTSTLTVDQTPNLNNVHIDGGTLNLNQDLVAANTALTNGATVSRAAGFGIKTNDLFVSSTDFQFTAFDAIGDSLQVSLGTLDIDQSLSLNGNFIASDAIVNINQSSNVSGLFDSSFGTLNVGAVLNVSAYVSASGTINLGADLTTPELYLGLAGATTVTRTSGDLHMDYLSLYNGSSLSLTGGDTLSTSLYVDSTSALSLDKALNVASTVDIDGGTLNVNQALSTSQLSIRNGAIVNRAFGVGITANDLYVTNSNYQLNGSDAIANSVNVSGGTLDVDTSTVLAGVSASDSTVNINNAINVASLQTQNSTVNVNAALESAGTWNSDAGTINQNADISVSQLALGWAGSATAFNRTSGDLHLDYLSLYSGSSLSLTGGDTVSTGLYVDSTSALSVDKALGGVSTVEVDGGTLNVNQALSTSQLSIRNGANVNRASGVGITANDLYVTNSNYQLNGSDAIANSVNVSGGTLDIDTPTTLAAGVSASDSTVNINNALNVASLQTHNSTVNVNAVVESVGSWYANSGEINQNADIRVSQIALGWAGNATAFNRASGIIDTDSVLLFSGSSLIVDNNDSVGNLQLTEDSQFQFEQLAGSATGLSFDSLFIDNPAQLLVQFDSVASLGLDWGLRLTGDQQTLLNGYLAGGQLVSSDSSAMVIYNSSSYGDFTYFGTISAVPEPTSLVLVSGAVGLAILRRRRSNA